VPRDDRDKSEFATRRAATDNVIAERHAGFDLAAQDITPKSHRPSFSVVGEGSKTANQAYLDGYAKINWKK
jgi:hypothetical protein